MFDWTRRAARGEIYDASGHIVPIQGVSDIYSGLYGADGSIVGVEGFAGDSSNAAVARSRLDGVANFIEHSGIIEKQSPPGLGLDFTEIASLVAVGFGVALVPKSFEVAGLSGIRYLHLSDCDTTSDLAVAYRKTEASPAVRAFVLHSRRLGGAVTGENGR